MRFIVLRPFFGDGTNWRNGDIVDFMDPPRPPWQKLKKLVSAGFLMEWPHGQEVQEVPAEEQTSFFTTDNQVDMPIRRPSLLTSVVFVAFRKPEDLERLVSAYANDADVGVITEREFPAKGGWICLQQPHWEGNRLIISGILCTAEPVDISVRVDGKEITGPLSVWMIEFDCTDIGRGQMKVKAACGSREPSVKAYFMELLEEIGRLWPETVRQLNLESLKSVVREAPNVEFPNLGAFSLETDTKSLLNWLEQHIRAIPKLAPSWGVDNIEGGMLATAGFYTGRDGRQLTDEETVTMLVGGGKCVKSEFEFHGLGFKLIPLPPSRVAVHAGYVGNGVKGFFRQVLIDIHDAFKESRKEIEAYLGGPVTDGPTSIASTTESPATVHSSADRRGLLQPVKSYHFHTDYRNVLNYLFRTGEFGAFGHRRRLFRDEGQGGLVCECFMGESTCIGHDACLVTTICIQFGEDYPGREALTMFADGKKGYDEVVNGFGMVITLDREKKGECKATLWLETKPREWLRKRTTPSLIRLEDGHVPSEPMPRWTPIFPGNRAIEFCQEVWRQIIDEWEAQDRSRVTEPADTRKERQHALPDAVVREQEQVAEERRRQFQPWREGVWKGTLESLGSAITRFVANNRRLQVDDQHFHKLAVNEGKSLLPDTLRLLHQVSFQTGTAELEGVRSWLVGSAGYSGETGFDAASAERAGFQGWPFAGIEAAEIPKGLQVWLSYGLPYQDLMKEYLGKLSGELVRLGLEVDQADNGKEQGPTVKTKAQAELSKKHGQHGGTMDRVREAWKLIHETKECRKTEACKRVGIDTRTYDRYAWELSEEDDFTEDE